jgi:MFS transporter, putative metabolite:H+ symporter
LRQGGEPILRFNRQTPWRGNRASRMGFGYGIGNLSKILGPLGLALIVGSSNYVNPQATVEAVFPAFLFLAFRYVLAARAFWLIAPETKGRSIEENDNALSEREPTTILAS